MCDIKVSKTIFDINWFYKEMCFENYSVSTGVPLIIIATCLTLLQPVPDQIILSIVQFGVLEGLMTNYT